LGAAEQSFDRTVRGSGQRDGAVLKIARGATRAPELRDVGRDAQFSRSPAAIAREV